MALLQLHPAQLARAGLHDPQPDRRRATARPVKPAAGKYSRGVQQHNDALSDLQIAAIDRMLNEKED